MLPEPVPATGAPLSRGGLADQVARARNTQLVWDWLQRALAQLPNA